MPFRLRSELLRRELYPLIKTLLMRYLIQSNNYTQPDGQFAETANELVAPWEAVLLSLAVSRCEQSLFSKPV